ncbi:MAG TPA: DUF4340 domain-containing protein [Planctomycetota bacterium]|nr:DUF4340 domain-containing protein [Planctomycetota bacterium]
MKETRTTLAFGGAALALLGLTLLTAPRHRPAEVFSDQGTVFYPDFKDPLKAASLEVVEFDESTATPRRFHVQFLGGRWVIPSHHNYPADAKDRLVKTAAAVIDLVREKFRSDNPKDHEAFGVVDPADEKVSGTRGRGKRVILRDLDGKVLADFIFGKEAGEGRRFVRLPGQKRVYETRTKAEISARFEDWIETDLLQLSQSAVRRIIIDRYSIDEQQLLSRGILVIKDRTTTTLAREDSTKPWTVSGMKENEEPHGDAISQMLNALDDLKIVGVRPKPPFLTKDLKASGEFKVRDRLTPQQMASLQSLQQKGFFVVPQGEESLVLSNEGDITVSCDDGVVYTLRFGEVIVGEGEEITAGAGEDKKEEKKDEKKGGKENRYLLVTARFDESLLGPPPAEPKPPAGYKPEDKKDDKKEGEKKQDPPEVEKYKKEKEEYDRKKQEYERKVSDGKKRAQELTDRFAEWYYVISDDLFKKLRRDPKELVKPKEEKKEGEPKTDGPKEDGKKPEEKKPEDKKEPGKNPEEKKP